MMQNSTVPKSSALSRVVVFSLKIDYLRVNVLQSFVGPVHLKLRLTIEKDLTAKLKVFFYKPTNQDKTTLTFNVVF